MGTVRKVALVTAVAVRGLDEDEKPLLAAFAARGASAVSLAWDDPRARWTEFDAAVVRSTWDYQDRLPEFLAWARRAADQTRLFNPLPMLEWSADKRYLRELAAAGLPVPDCQWVEPGDSWQVPTGPTHREPHEYVIKPVVSAGSRNTSRHQAGHDDQRAEETVARLLAQGHTLVVQPYLSAVDSAGETALVYLGGRYSHALRKGPLLAPGGQLAENITARQPAPAELRVGDQVLATVVERFAAVPAYLRVDLLPGPDGVPVVLECELVEPGLWLDQREGAADELAEWVLAALGRALP